MRNNRITWKGMGIGLLLLIPILWCRYSTPAADFYATRVYPYISAALSRFASLFTPSLTEIAVALAIAALFFLIIRALWLKVRWWECILQVAVLLLWVYVWFYAAWGINYYRSDIFARTGSAPMPYEEEEFHAFLDEFAEQLNANWYPRAEEPSLDGLESEVKTWYGALPEECGLSRPRSWQHPKRLIFNRIYSAVGVLGFIGPAFDEMHVNADITPLERPFVFAHEYSHVLGVSSEAEANFWAFEATRRSEDQAVRYSAWFSLLTFTSGNIRSLLGDEGFKAWTATLRPEILEDIDYIGDYWAGRRWMWLAKLQHRFYNFFLRSNRISDGTKNYGQVLRLVLTFSDLHSHEDGEEG